jgi:hypothetical protein
MPDVESLKILSELHAQASSEQVAEYRGVLSSAITTAPKHAAGGKQWSIEGMGKVVSVTGPVYTSFEEVSRRTEEEFRKALERASILEHRALVTGVPADAEAYVAALSAVDRAAAKLWATSAFAVLKGRVEVERRQAELWSGIEEATRQLSAGHAVNDKYMALVAKRRAVYAESKGVHPPAPCALQLVARKPNVVTEARNAALQRRKVQQMNAKVARKVKAARDKVA